MAIFEQENNSCYFIHIPRTGGRYISSLFENTPKINCKHHTIHTTRIAGIDVTHLHYPLYEHYLDVENIPHITIVRNPYDKFVSCIRNMHSLHKIDYNQVFSNEEKFYKFIKTEIEINSFHNNWFLPQNQFFSPKTNFWKYEYGFGENFRQWVFDKTKIRLNHEKVHYKRFDGETNEKYNLDSRVESYVKNFYKKDYQLFKYCL